MDAPSSNRPFVCLRIITLEAKLVFLIFFAQYGILPLEHRGRGKVTGEGGVAKA